MTAHFPSLFDPLGPLTESATRAASANASLTPRFFIAEHSVLPSAHIPPPASTCVGRRFPTEISQRLYPPRHLQPLFVVDRLLLPPLRAGLAHLVLVLGVVFAQVAFQRDQDQLDALAVLCDLADPFRFDVFERVFGVDLVVAKVELVHVLSVGRRRRRMRKVLTGRTLKQSMMACVSS